MENRHRLDISQKSGKSGNNSTDVTFYNGQSRNKIKGMI